MESSDLLVQPAIDYEFRLAGRVFPSHDSDVDRVDRIVSPAEAQVQQSFEELHRSLDANLAEIRAELAKVRKALTPEESVYFYRQSRRSLLSRLQAWNEFVASLVQVRVLAEAINRNSGAWEKTHREKIIGEALQDANISPLSLPSDLVTSSLLASGHGQIVSVLTAQMESCLDTIADQLCEQLLALVQYEIIGIIEWNSESTCHYSRYARTTQLLRGREILVWEDSEMDEGGSWVSERIDYQAELQHQLVRTIEHLVNVERKELEDNGIVVPIENQKVIDCIPHWIRMAACIVDGTLVRELVVAKNVKKESLTIRGKANRYYVMNDLELWSQDPAVVLGPFVLTGWGNTETEREIQRRNWSLPAMDEVANFSTNASRFRSETSCKGGVSLILLANLLIVASPSLLGLICSLTIAVLSVFVFEWRESKETSFVGYVREFFRNSSYSSYLHSYATYAGGVSLLSTWSLVAGFFLLGLTGYVLSALLLYAIISEKS